MNDNLIKKMCQCGYFLTYNSEKELYYCSGCGWKITEVEFDYQVLQQQNKKKKEYHQHNFLREVDQGGYNEIDDINNLSGLNHLKL